MMPVMNVLGPRHLWLRDLPRHSLRKGISKDLNCEECFLAEASSDLLAQWYSLHKQIFAARSQNWYEKRGLRRGQLFEIPRALHNSCLYC